jgi:hypothetical protein
MSFLKDGYIPGKSDCPFRSRCPLWGCGCEYKPFQENEYSCGAARGWDIEHSDKLKVTDLDTFKPGTNVFEFDRFRTGEALFQNTFGENRIIVMPIHQDKRAFVLVDEANGLRWIVQLPEIK